MTAPETLVSDIEAQQQRLAYSKQQWQTLIRLVASKPGEMSCEESAARVLASMGIPSPGRAAKAPSAARPVVDLRGPRRHMHGER